MGRLTVEDLAEAAHAVRADVPAQGLEESERSLAVPIDLEVRQGEWPIPVCRLRVGFSR